MHWGVLQSGALSSCICRLHQCRNNFTNAASHARLVNEFNGLVIPSRQELLSQQGDSAMVDSQEPLSTTSRPDPTITQRRAARLAREAAMAATHKSDNPRAPPDRRQNTSRVMRGQQTASRRQPSSAATTSRRTPNANRFQGLDALGQFLPIASVKNVTRDRVNRESRGDTSNAPRKGRPGARMVPGKRPAIVKPSSPLPQKLNAKEASLESIEEGGEEPRKARLTIPETPSVDLSDILCRVRSSFGVVLAPRHNGALASSPVKDRTKYITEAIGGDYTRYSPHVMQDYLTKPRELSVIKQAHITLSKNKAIDLNERELLLRVVAAAAPSPAKRIARA